ncbi:RHTO0S18e02740g1_1 [Rhodotorula toruloides]|uniref:non-specific serine/threonine protein kinase n=1 Tax=Rhodotorula toruloides TaxID=5286 RepID=A0A061BNC8_RHOTO|nr:RHTO0S18e02740g1_1 [Rhodotorula toruloides]
MPLTPSTPSSPSPPRSPRPLFPPTTASSPSPSLAPALLPTSSPSSTNSSGSGSARRGRRATRRAGSVQARRSVASLGLGVQFANMNELTGHGGGSGSGSLSPAGSGSAVGSTSPSPQRKGGSRRSSVQFATATPSSPPRISSPSSPTIPPTASLFPPAAGTTAPSAAPLSTPSLSSPTFSSASLATAGAKTHLASFLSGITHHTRVRSPGPSGGRGVSRSASRSHSRASSVSGRSRMPSSGGGSEAGAAEEEGESWTPGDGVGEWEDGAQGGTEGREFNWFGTALAGSTTTSGFNGPTGRFRSPSASSRPPPHTNRARSTSSRASSIHTRSRRNSLTPSLASATSHPLLHELVRENTTGGVVPSEVVQGGEGKVQQWEATYETYKPSVLTTPRFQRTTTDEEPFLDSAPNSPRAGAGQLVARTKTYDSFVSSSEDGGESAASNDLSAIDVFEEGERIGVGVWLEGRGGYVRDCFAGRADMDGKAPGNGLDGPRQLEIERRLGEGTYAIVYLVREVLYDPDPTDDDILSPIDPLASFEFDDRHADANSDTGSTSGRPRLHSWSSDFYAPPPKPTYGQYYALKCLCKKNLTEDLIEVQRNEAFLHRALPKHENIVQMYGAYETDDWLFLVLEYAGGRDAFYWLLEAQEHGTEDLYSRAASPAAENSPNGRSSFDFDNPDPDDSSLSRTITADTPAHLLVDETPPSPSLLSAAMGDQLLSRKRLRLISRMFGQMCSAVQACHDVGISHRDIKPENFIVIDGKGDRGSRAAGLPPSAVTQGPDGKQGVVVKITDWGLGTMEEVCEDFDCGSKPYMAYECRNNLRPTYDPRQADVWSLGLVFLNLLYHRNPWADPSLDDPDFAEYVEDPIGFLQNRFEGMSDEVAHYLADNVFCDVLEIVDGKERRRVSAGEFGKWASRLVMMLGEGQLGQQRPQIASSDSFSAFEFSPVATMPLTIPGGGPPTTSLLSQFAPSTVKANQSIFDDLPNELPTVPEVAGDSSFRSNAPSFPTSSTPSRPAYISSPSAISEDGDSLPSPTFPSPPVPNARLPAGSNTTSPEGLQRPLPWSTPSITTSPSSLFASPPPSETATSSPVPASSPLPQPALPVAVNAPSGLSLLAARRPSLFDAQHESALSAASTVVPDSGTTSQAASPEASPGEGRSTPQTNGVEPPSSDDGTKSGDGDGAVEHGKEGSSEESKDDPEAKAAAEKAHKSKRRKRGARKEKRAAKQAEREKGGSGAASPISPIASPRSTKLPTVNESTSTSSRDHVLDDLAAASQELARELSSTRSGSSHRSSRSRPGLSSRSHGTQSTSAIPTLPQDIPPLPSKKGGMFGRLKTLVNEGNQDLEAFKRRVEERNASIGANADTTSAPAKMQGARAPRGKYDSPFSSRGSVGTASWGSNWSGNEPAGGADESRGRGSAHDHWSSASTRRDRLAGRRGQPAGPGSAAVDFSPSSSSLTRGGPSTLSAFDSASRTHTPLSSFGSVGSPLETKSTGTATSTTTATGREWRSPSPSRAAPRPYSSSRARESPLPALAPALAITGSTPLAAAAAPRPKLRDAATDTSDLGKLSTSPPPPPLQTSASSPTISTAPARPPPQPTASPAPSPTPAPATLPNAAGGGGKTNKLAKMLNSISVFNRTQVVEKPSSSPSPSPSTAPGAGTQ